MFKFNKMSGQASKLLLVLAIVVLVAAILVYLIMKMATKPPAPAKPAENPVVLPVYEKQLGNIDFIFESALDRGQVLKASDAIPSDYGYTTDKDLTIDNSGAKFIQVTIGAKNVGTTNTEQNAWDIENIIDSKNREFVPLNDYSISPWLPNPSLCGALLKPAFAPTPCVKMYEVSKESTGLKIRVRTGVDNSANNLSSGKTNTFLIDLIVK